MTTRTVILSGRAYSLAVEGSSIPEKEGWPKPVFRRWGPGFQAIYVDVDESLAWLIQTQLEDLFSLYDGGGGDGFTADARILRLALERNGWWPR